MLQRMAHSPKAVSSVMPEKPEEYTIPQLKKELDDVYGKKVSYSLIYAFIHRHNRANPEARIVPVQRTITGRKIFIKYTDAAIIRDGILYPERSEHPAWEE